MGLLDARESEEPKREEGARMMPPATVGPGFQNVAAVREIKVDRRRLFHRAAMTLAAGQLGVLGSMDARSSKAKPAEAAAIKPGTKKSFGLLKQINAGLLDVGYAEVGPANGPAVIPLHGWP